MKLESQITNNHSSIIDNQLKRPSTTVEIALQIHSILTNKPNLRNDKMDINAFETMSYVNLGAWRVGKTKPIQTQFKANLSQFKPIKPKTNPKQSQFVERGKNKSFCVVKEPYDRFNNATRGFYHPEGCRLMEMLKKVDN